jgi:hypothetical protein
MPVRVMEYKFYQQKLEINKPQSALNVVDKSYTSIVECPPIAAGVWYNTMYSVVQIYLTLNSDSPKSSVDLL